MENHKSIAKKHMLLIFLLLTNWITQTIDNTTDINNTTHKYNFPPYNKYFAKIPKKSHAKIKEFHLEILPRNKKGLIFCLQGKLNYSNFILLVLFSININFGFCVEILALNIDVG